MTEIAHCYQTPTQLPFLDRLDDHPFAERCPQGPRLDRGPVHIPYGHLGPAARGCDARSLVRREAVYAIDVASRDCDRAGVRDARAGDQPDRLPRVGPRETLRITPSRPQAV